MKKYRAVIEILIEADSDSDASDGVGELLTTQMQKYDPESCLLDWQFVEDFNESDGKQFSEYNESAELEELSMLGI